MKKTEATGRLRKNVKRKKPQSVDHFFKENVLGAGGLWSRYVKSLRTAGMAAKEVERFSGAVEPVLTALAQGFKVRGVALSQMDLGLLLGFTAPELLPERKKSPKRSELYWHPTETVRLSENLGVFRLDVTKLPYSARREVLHHFITLVYDPGLTLDEQMDVLRWMAEEKIGQMEERGTIKVGILHSLTGTMALSERPLVDATMMAIDEINAAGGVLGRRIEPIVVDGASDWDTFAEGAVKLVTEDGVSSVFGGWTSASRKAMKPIFEKYGNLLWYPLQYEGLEESANIMYTGAAPNQQMLPAVNWAFKNLGKTFFLVGSDYVFPRSANAIMRAHIEELGGTVVGEEYEELGGRNFTGIVGKIRKARPAVILNTINGDSNIAFFKQLRKAGIAARDIPTLSFSVAEEEIIGIGPASVAGDFAAWNYFQSQRSQRNRSFVKHFQKKYGKKRVTDDPVEAAYFGVYLFAQAVEKANSDDVLAVRDAAKGQVVYAPEGEVMIDPDSQHVYRTARIGQIRNDGQFDIVWSSDTPIKPEPYPHYKSKREWEDFLEGLYNGWGKHWAKQ